jgi:uncharacterized protein YuzE
MDVSYVDLVPGGIPDGGVTRTVEVGTAFNVDVDSDGRVMGVEVFGTADWRDALAGLALRGRLHVDAAPRP